MIVETYNLPTSSDEKDGWTETLPTEPNTLWWFCGWRSRYSLADKKMELATVQIWKNGNNTVVYVADGAFFYPEKDGAVGLWKRIDVTLPTPNRLLALP